jgi:hypothetical protein
MLVGGDANKCDKLIDNSYLQTSSTLLKLPKLCGDLKAKKIKIPMLSVLLNDK